MGSVGAAKASSSTGASAFSFENMSENEAQSKIKEMQAAMGQSGYEAGDPNAGPSGKLYANTGKAFNINAYLMSDGKTIKSDKTDWHNYITKAWVQNAINKMDAGMKPLSESVQTFRYIGFDALKKMLGVKGTSIDKFVDKIQSGKGKDFSELLKNADYTHKGYTSTTYKPEHGSYDEYAVRLDIKMSEGVNAIVTNNHKEHEIVGKHHQKYDFPGTWHVETTKSGKKQLVLDVVFN